MTKETHAAVARTAHFVLNNLPGNIQDRISLLTDCLSIMPACEARQHIAAALTSCQVHINHVRRSQTELPLIVDI